MKKSEFIKELKTLKKRVEKLERVDSWPGVTYPPLVPYIAPLPNTNPWISGYPIPDGTGSKPFPGTTWINLGSGTTTTTVGTDESLDVVGQGDHY